MNGLADYLVRITHLLQTKHLLRKTIADICAEHNIALREEEVVVRDGVLRCNISPVAKNHLFMHRQSILAAINQKVPNAVRSIE
jgi:hypothetical protein